LQLGTGSWWFGAGSVFTAIRDRQRFSAEGIYRHPTRHDGFRPSASLDLNLAYWYRLSPAVFAPEREAIEVRGGPGSPLALSAARGPAAPLQRSRQLLGEQTREEGVAARAQVVVAPPVVDLG
jgi:hypothetical protein